MRVQPSAKPSDRARSVRLARCVHCDRGVPLGDAHHGDHVVCPHCGTEIELHRVRGPRRRPRRRSSFWSRMVSAASVARVPPASLERTARRVGLITIALAICGLVVANYDVVAEFLDTLVRDARSQSKGAK